MNANKQTICCSFVGCMNYQNCEHHYTNMPVNSGLVTGKPHPECHIYCKTHNLECDDTAADEQQGCI